MSRLGDRGSAVVAAVLTLPLIAGFFMLVAQVIVFASLHSNAVHAAAEGARAAAVSPIPQFAALMKIQGVMHATANGTHIDNVTTTVGAISGVPTVRVVVTASAPTLWIGGRHQVTGAATVVREVGP